MDVREMRHLAIKYAKLHLESRRAFLDSWKDWRHVRGDRVTERFLFGQETRTRELIDDQQMYARFALLWSNMALMEMKWEEKGDE